MSTRMKHDSIRQAERPNIPPPNTLKKLQQIEEFRSSEIFASDFVLSEPTIAPPRRSQYNLAEQDPPYLKIQRAQNLLSSFFYEVSRFNFEKCERFLDPNPAKTSMEKKMSSQTSGSKK